MRPYVATGKKKRKNSRNGRENHTDEAISISILARRELELFGGALYTSLVSTVSYLCDIPDADADFAAGRDLVKVYIHTKHEGDNGIKLIDKIPPGALTNRSKDSRREAGDARNASECCAA